MKKNREKHNFLRQKERGDKEIQGETDDKSFDDKKKNPERNCNLTTLGIKVNTTPLININELIL